MNRYSKSPSAIIVFTMLALLILLLLPLTVNSSKEYSPISENSILPQQCCLEFNGTRAFTYLEEQCAFGPRPPGSSNLTACGNYIITSLENQGWNIQTQTWTHQDTSLRNIIAGASSSPRYVLLAHYDTRPIADMDPNPENRTQPILGANDGASGVAALLELASVLPEGAQNVVTLLFVDAEDSGNWNGWEYIVGSTYYV
ncbi:MAG: M28 family peptidase, partial [Promethearchaeota archaeon]